MNFKNKTICIILLRGIHFNLIRRIYTIKSGIADITQELIYIAINTMKT